MPGEVLSEPFAGLFGKLPASGDFVARGLPDAFRSRWDAWATRHLARRAEPWPEGGLRLRLRSGGRTAVGLVLPSQDAVGRRFPLSAFLVLPFPPGLAEADRWCDGALPLLRAATSGESDADALWEALALLPPAEGPAEREAPPLTLWAEGSAPRAADPLDPEPTLAELLSSG